MIYASNFGKADAVRVLLEMGAHIETVTNEVRKCARCEGDTLAQAPCKSGPRIKMGRNLHIGHVQISAGPIRECH